MNLGVNGQVHRNPRKAVQPRPTGRRQTPNLLNKTNHGLFSVLPCRPHRVTANAVTERRGSAVWAPTASHSGSARRVPAHQLITRQSVRSGRFRPVLWRGRERECFLGRGSRTRNRTIDHQVRIPVSIEKCVIRIVMGLIHFTHEVGEKKMKPNGFPMSFVVVDTSLHKFHLNRFEVIYSKRFSSKERSFLSNICLGVSNADVK